MNTLTGNFPEAAKQAMVSLNDPGNTGNYKDEIALICDAAKNQGISLDAPACNAPAPSGKAGKGR